MKLRSPSKSSLRPGLFSGVFCAAALLMGVPCAAHAGTYTWNTTSGANWSTTTDWTPTAPTGGPGAGDTANLGNTTANRTVVYDSAAAVASGGSGALVGKLGTLNFAETSGVNNELQIAAGYGLNVSNAVTVGGASVTGTETLDLQGANSTTAPSAAFQTSTLTIGNNGVLLLGLSGGSNNETFLSGALVLNAGGAITTSSSVGSGTAGSTEVETLGGTGTLAMNGGTLTLNQGAGGGVRLAISKTFTASGGTIAFAGTNTGSNGLNQLYLSGTGNSIGANVTITAAGTGLTGNGAEINLNTTGNQTLTYANSGTAGTNIFDLHIRYNSASGIGVKNIAYNGTGTGYIGTLYLNSTTAGGTGSLQLGSNLTTDSSRSVILTKDSNASAGTLNLDLNGYTLDGTAAANGLAYASGANGLNNTNGTNSTSGTDNFTITSTTTGGTLKATGFNFDAGTGTNNLRIAIGAGVVLQATGTIANDFGSGTPTAGTSTATFDPTSTFLYTGSAATVTTGTNTLGAVTVGNGTAASVLTVNNGGMLNTAGLVTVNAGSTLLVNGTTATTAGAGMTVNGTLGGTGTVGHAVNLTNGGVITGGTVGSVGMLTLTSNATLSGGTYQADISGATSDRLTLSGATLTLSGATLTISGTLDGTTTYDIANYASESGTFAATNLPSNYTIQYNATEIDLVPMTAVPEPSTWLGGVGLLVGLGWRSIRRRSAA